MLKHLTEAGFNYTNEVVKAGIKGLKEIPGVGEKTAKKILERINGHE
ncbi:MAG: helix-hairpin-helix domain-containing protein [bacterium]